MMSMKTLNELKFLHRITPEERRHLDFVWRISISKERLQLVRLADRFINGLQPWNDQAVEALLGNSRLPLEKVLQVMNRFPVTESLAHTICRREDASADILDTLADKLFGHCLDAILEHTNTRAETIERVAHRTHEPYSAIRAIRSGRLSDRSVYAFTFNDNECIREEAARWTKSSERLAAMLQDPWANVRLGAVRNTRTTRKQLQHATSKDPDEGVRQNAQQRLELNRPMKKRNETT